MSDYTLEELATELAALDFDRFGYDEAWELGRRFHEQSVAQGLPVALAVFLGDQLVFQSALRGTSADTDDWLRRKARTVRRFGVSTLAVMRTFEARGWSFDERSKLDPRKYAAAGGGYPIIVAGSLVGAVVASGLPHLRDHELVVGLLTALRDGRHDAASGAEGGAS